MVFCHTCLRMFKENKVKTATKADQAFVSFDYCRFGLFFVCKSKCLMFFAFVSRLKMFGSFDEK